MNQELVIGYVLVLSGRFDLIFELGSTRPFNGGLAGLSLVVMADREDLSYAAWRA
jgi:hypothetical protein